MADNLTRRNFMKAAGATAGLVVASGWSPRAYAQNDRINIALIGTGSQNCFHIEHGIAGNPQLRVAAMADVLRPSLANARKALCGDDEAKLKEISSHLYLDYREMLEKEKDNIDAVVIATPFKTHYEIVMDCLDAGKFVFCEKTMAHTIECCRNIVTKCHETGLFVQCGHQRRYSPDYIHAAKGMCEDKRLGRVTYMEAQWHRNGDWRRPRPRVVVNKETGETAEYQLTPAEQALITDFDKLINWRVYEEYSAGLISELATHHIEVMNWLMGTPPARVYASGGTDYWKDGRTTGDNIIIVMEYDLNARHHGFFAMSAKNTIQEKEPYYSQLRRPYTVRATWTGSLQTSMKGEGILVLGDKGMYELHEKIDPAGRGCKFQAEPVRIWLDPKTMNPTTDENIINYITSTGQSQKFSRLEDQPLIVFETEVDQALQTKISDVYQFEAFAKHIKEGGKPRTNEMCGLIASICDIAAHESLVQKKTIDVDRAWYTFDFETPDPFIIA